MVGKKVLLLGGDLRMSYLADILDQDNEVFAFRVPNVKERSLQELSQIDFDLIIGPIPISRDGIKLLTTYGEEILLKELFDVLKGDFFVGCKIPKALEPTLQKGIGRWEDILERDDFAIENALPTAEGAIKVAIEKTPYQLTGCKCLVLGFGRCGKVLADKLKAFGANVAVEARKVKDLASIRAYGYEEVQLKDLKDKIGQYQIIFNTIPYLILDQEMLDQVNTQSLVIDLASKPGGCDFEYAKRKGVEAILALGLPGQYAPWTASQIIIRCIENML